MNSIEWTHVALERRETPKQICNNSNNSNNFNQCFVKLVKPWLLYCKLTRFLVKNELGKQKLLFGIFIRLANNKNNKLAFTLEWTGAPQNKYIFIKYNLGPQLVLLPMTLTNIYQNESAIKKTRSMQSNFKIEARKWKIRNIKFNESGDRG